MIGRKKRDGMRGIGNRREDRSDEKGREEGTEEEMRNEERRDWEEWEGR